jgi:hypothetical protein
MRQSIGAPATPGQAIILRAYKTSLPSPVPDFQIIGNGTWFTFNGTPLDEDANFIQNLNSLKYDPQHNFWRWHYQRLEFWNEGSQFVLILPTLSDPNINRSWISLETDGGRFYLHLKFHYSCVIGRAGVGRATTSVGMELQLFRNGAGSLTQMRQLTLSDTRIIRNPTPAVPYGAMTQLLASGGAETFDNPDGPLLQAFASHPWTSTAATVPSSNQLTSRLVSVKVSTLDEPNRYLPTLSITNEDLHIATGSTGPVDVLLGSLTVDGGATVGRLTQTPSAAWLRGDPGSDTAPWIATANLMVGPIWNSIHKTYQNSLLTIRPGNSTTFLPRLTDIQPTQTPLEVQLSLGIAAPALPSFNQRPSELQLVILTAVLSGSPRVTAGFALAGC